VNGPLVGGLLLGLGSAGAIGGGFALQHRGAAALPPLSPRRPLRALRLLAGRPLWVGGFCLGLAGWAAYVAALRLAPLSLVQAASAGGLVVLALAGGPLSRLERAGVACALAGLVLLGASLGGAAGGRPAPVAAVVLWLTASAAAAALLAGPGARVLVPGAGLATAAGILYGAADVATKEAVGGGTRLAFAAAVLACSGMAFGALQLAFQRGGPLATAGLATLWTNALPILAGGVLFAEPFPGGWHGGARAAAFVLVVLGGAALARAGSGRYGGDTGSAGVPTVTTTIAARAAPRGPTARTATVCGPGAAVEASHVSSHGGSVAV
jgi:hypothetical protein